MVDGPSLTPLLIQVVCDGKNFQPAPLDQKYMARKWQHESVKALFETKGVAEGEDAIPLIKSMARELVLEAYNCGWSGPPFNLVDLAEMRGMEVVPNELVIDARIVPREDGTYRIEYNPFQSEARINFSIAHEIGHTLFPDCKKLIRNREQQPEKDSWELEFLCNVAAAEILLPYALFAVYNSGRPS